MSKSTSSTNDIVPFATAEYLSADVPEGKTATRSTVHPPMNRVDLNSEEVQRFVLRRRVKLLSELTHLSKNIKDHCKTLLGDTYVEGTSPKDIGIHSSIRHQRPDSLYLFGEAIYEIYPFVFDQFLEVLQHYRAYPVNLKIPERFGI